MPRPALSLSFAEADPPPKGLLRLTDGHSSAQVVWEAADVRMFFDSPVTLMMFAATLVDLANEWEQAQDRGDAPAPLAPTIEMTAAEKEIALQVARGGERFGQTLDRMVQYVRDNP